MAKCNKYEVVGYKPVSYVSRRTGKPKSGCEVYLRPVEYDEGVIGDQVEAVYLNEFATYVPEIGDNVRKIYNQYRSLEDLILI